MGSDRLSFLGNAYRICTYVLLKYFILTEFENSFTAKMHLIINRLQIFF